MSLGIAFGVYFICWWLAFFIMLPIGVRTDEREAIESGFATSAPVDPKLGLKALGATVLSAVIFAVVYVVIAYRLIPLDSIPMSL
jgi:predicted secreted protein